ncbi:dTDP-4-dehydrorhamnose reductase [Polynucleobacter sp. UK-FUSCHL-C3]|uniref:dTDP-4-dehydrorhamnose reductase n=1 Tax=Polynucleobacter sp. UK-FUSCHL-C3 TaxID=2955208 RepID=A0AAU8A2T8_9BURK
MNILVFGKDGQLGKAFKAIFGERKPEKLHRISYIGRTECDLANPDAITVPLNQIKPDLIINAAAHTAVDRAETEVDSAYAINTKAPEIMAQYAKNHGATFLHYSTDYVFDGSKVSPYESTDVRNPLGVYGKSKAAGEEAIERAFQDKQKHASQVSGTELKAQYAILRTSWVYGEGGNFIRTILRLAKERQTLKVIADQYGVPSSARWLAEVSLALTLDENNQLRQFPSGIYHAVPSGETTWHALACHAVQAALDAGAALQLHPNAIEAIPATEYPLPAPRPMNSRMARGSLEAALADTLAPSANVPKLQLLQQSWEPQVAAYVQDLVHRKLI